MASGVSGRVDGQGGCWQGDDVEQRLLRNRQLLGQLVNHINRGFKSDFGNQFCSAAGHQAKLGGDPCWVEAVPPRALAGAGEGQNTRVIEKVIITTSVCPYGVLSDIKWYFYSASS